MSPTTYDIYQIETDSIPVTFQSGQLTEIQGRNDGYANCRVIMEGKVGYYASNTKSDAEMIKLASDSSPWGKDCTIELPQPAKLQKVDVYSKATADVTSKQMVDWGRQIVEGISRELGNHLPVDVNLERIIGKRSVRNSNGVGYEERFTSIGLSAGVTDAREGDIHSEFSFISTVDAKNIVLEPMIAEIVHLFRTGESATSVEGGILPVIIHPYAVEQFLMPLFSGINGERIKDGTSPLKERLGEELFHPSFTLRDDPLWTESSTSSAFDAEGVVSRPRVLVDKGKLMGFNHTLETAAALGVEPTGGAKRGSNGKPSPYGFNYIMEPGDSSYEKMLSSIDRGLFLRYMSGAGQANVLAGEFCMGVYSGFLIEKGKLSRRLKGVMVTGNLYNAFKSISAISQERLVMEECNGSFLLPYIQLEGLNIAG